MVRIEEMKTKNNKLKTLEETNESYNNLIFILSYDLASVRHLQKSCLKEIKKIKEKKK